jgi:hypothetical protein
MPKRVIVGNASRHGKGASVHMARSTDIDGRAGNVVGAQFGDRYAILLQDGGL